ncbi:MAG: sulfatase-like hydrolase/transferase [Deltaproteobacteria bacterium]|nr:sulfatase-like hydrolase/transferase [Deltaproteobacteria bacterium]
MIDTLRADRIGPAGTPAPNLARRAGRAALFENAEATAPFTMPSIASLMTGLYPDRTGVIAHVPGAGLRTPAGWTLAEAARAAGLTTGAVIANPWLSRASSGFARGFDVFLGNRDGAGLPKHADARTVTDAALALLEQWRGRRFFLWVHYFDPHMPYRPPADNAAAVGAPPGGSRVVEDFASSGRDLTSLYAGAGYSAQELAATRLLYDGEVNYVDAQLERLRQGLDSVGATPTTVTVVVSDHGESLGEHGLFFAHDFTVYEELTHVALMMSGPSIAPGRRQQPVSLIDVAPTLCRLLGLSCRADVDGSDLLADPGGAPPDRAIFAAGTPLRERGARFAGLSVPGTDGRWSMVRRGNHKLVEIPTPSGSRFELYDLGSDALELTNAFADPAQATTARELGALLEDWHGRMSRSRPAPAPPDATATEEDERTLRSLGYLE